MSEQIILSSRTSSARPGRTVQNRDSDLCGAERGFVASKDVIGDTLEMLPLASASSTIEVVPFEVSHGDDAPLTTKDSKKAVSIELEINRPAGCENALIEKPALRPQTSDSGDDIHSPSPSAKATESSPEVSPVSKSKVAPSMPLESIVSKLNSSELNRKDDAKTVLAGTDSKASTAPSIVSTDSVPIVSSPVLKKSAEAEQSIVQPPTSNGGDKGARTLQTIPTIASTSRKIDKQKTSRNSSMTEAVNKMSKSALRLRQDPSISSSRSAAKPSPLSALADTSNKVSKKGSSSGTSSAKQRKQPVIQPRENKAAALRAKKNRGKVEEQKLKEKMEEMRKKKEQQRKEKEIERNVEQRWCSGV